MSNWWDVSLDNIWSNRYDDDVGDWAYSALMDNAIRKSGTVYSFNKRGRIHDAREFLSKIEKLGGRKVFVSFDAGDEFLGEYFVGTVHYIWKDSYISVYFQKDMSSFVKTHTINETFYNTLRIIIEESVKEIPDSGSVYVLIKTVHGIELQEAGKLNCPIEKGNYADKIVEGYEHIVKDIANPHPCGRLILLAGEPGTGKTYFVKGLISCVKSAKFVMIPPSLVGDLVGPDLISLLIAHNVDYGDGGVPIVLVIEDADTCLSSRTSDNIASISSLLNLGDGIIGSLLDVRILATTNQRHRDIDPAISRPGRLCRFLTISELSQEKSLDIYQRLTGKRPKSLGSKRVSSSGLLEKETVKDLQSKLTLAEIYRKARDDGWFPKDAKQQSYPSSAYRTYPKFRDLIISKKITSMGKRPR